ncbi:MAG: hypothetical protein H7A21_01445 [Spirochaetales bacterium]|nr:hypothetical protein [Spirochaetales bacterium]MCP5485587.1 hypothetical protein [Spirochaetales bacterium]
MRDRLERNLAPLVGLAFFLALAIVSYFTIFVGAQVRAGPVRLPVRLQTAEGLQAGVLVYVNGVEMGVVGSLHYMTLNRSGWPRPYAREHERSHGQTVIAVLYMRAPIVLYPDYRIVSRYLTVLSPRVIEIDPGSANLESTGPDRRLAPVTPLTLNPDELALFRRKGYLPRRTNEELLEASNYDDPLFLIASVVNENRSGIHEITANLRDITDKLNQGNHTVAALVNRADLVQGSNDFLKSVIILTEEVRGGAEDLRETRAAVDFLDLLLVLAGALF